MLRFLSEILFNAFRLRTQIFLLSVLIIPFLLKREIVLMAFAVVISSVYIDAREFYNHISVNQYLEQSLVCNLYIKGGIRSVEIGSVMFGKYNKEGELIPLEMD